MATTTDLTITHPTEAPDYLPPPDPKAVEQAMLIGDLSQMTDAQRIAYYVATCRSMNLNPLTKPFQALQGDDGKLSLYPDKGCAEQLRKLHRVSVRVLSREFLDDLYIVTVEASTPDGRVEEAQGIVPIAKEKGTWEDYEYQGKKRRRFKPAVDSNGQAVMLPLTASERATALMRAETKAKRRVTLAICGLGLPDWDQEPDSAAHPQALHLQTTPAGIEQAKDVTQHSADLFGDATNLQTVAAAYVPRIEAVILAQPGGNVADWNRWAERRFRKSRDQFTEADWQMYLEHVERLAQTQERPNPSGALTPLSAPATEDEGSGAAYLERLETQTEIFSLDAEPLPDAESGS